MDFKHSETLGDWNKWKKTLAKAVDIGSAVGMSQDTITNIGTKVGNALSSTVDPENREQRVLQELWRVGDDEDRHTLSKLIVKMVETDEN